MQGRKATRKGGDGKVEQEQGGDKAKSETASSLRALGMAESRHGGLMVRLSRTRQSRAGPHRWLVWCANRPKAWPVCVCSGQGR